MSSLMGGGKFKHGFLSAAFTAGASVGGVFGSANVSNLSGKLQNAFKAALVGGTASVLSGGKFANGAITGAFSRMFNDINHALEKSALKKYDEIRAKIRAQHINGSSINLTGEDVENVIKYEALTVENIGELSQLDYLRTLIYEADGLFWGYRFDSFTITSGDIVGTFTGSDINYSYQGILTAARGDTLYGMDVRIEMWNFFQGDSQQIPNAKRWARKGYNVYNELHQ
jgi:hypothetical protein